MKRLEGRVALVTGGNSGIGRGIVHRFVKEGATVAFAARDKEKGEKVLAEIAGMGGEGAFYALDLADEGAVKDLIARIERRFGLLVEVPARRKQVPPRPIPGIEDGCTFGEHAGLVPTRLQEPNAGELTPGGRIARTALGRCKKSHAGIADRAGVRQLHHLSDKCSARPRAEQRVRRVGRS